MVRSEIYRVYGDTFNYLVKNTMESLNYLSSDIPLDPKTLRNCMKGGSVSESVLIKCSEYFGVPINFFSDYSPANTLTLKSVLNWEKYARNLDTDSEFEYFIDENIDSRLMKENLNLFEKFISEITLNINNNKTNAKKSNFSEQLDIEHKLDKLKRFEKSFLIVEIGTEISKKFNVFVGRYNHWILNTSTLEEFDHVVHIAYKKQLIHIESKDKNERDTVSYKVGLGNPPPNPSHMWRSQKETIHRNSMWLDYYLDFKNSQFFSQNEMKKLVEGYK